MIPLKTIVHYVRPSGGLPFETRAVVVAHLKSHQEYDHLIVLEKPGYPCETASIYEYATQKGKDPDTYEKKCAALYYGNHGKRGRRKLVLYAAQESSLRALPGMCVSDPQ